MEGERAPPAVEGRTCPERGLRWFQEATFHFTVFGGEELVPSAWLNANTYVGGFRCRRCHHLILRY